MSTIRIWAVNSDHDAKSVKRLAEKFLTDSQPGHLSIQTADKKAFLVRKGKSLSDALRKATQHYLKQDERVIFVTDSITRMPAHQQPQESDALIYHTEQVVRDNIFDGKVFLARGVHELKVWLPIVHKSLEGGSTTWQEEWNCIVASFHDAFADTPEEEVVRDLDETLAEVRREQT